MAEKLIKATWYGNTGPPPDKFVVLVDVDGSAPDEILGSFHEDLPQRLTGIDASIQYAFAQWHLEAWYFADAVRLREYLGRDLGASDVSKPDELSNPKLRLKHLLGPRIYTARISEDIARRLDPFTVAQRSPSFQGFLAAVMNGSPA